MLTAVILLVLCSYVERSWSAEPPGGYYTTRYDHLDVENILNQKRLVHYYAACLLDRGPCTPQGTEFKSILPEAIKTNCLRCTEKQRVVTTRAVRRLKKEYPDVWKELEKSWDPTGEYVKRLEGFVNRPIPVTFSPASITTTTTTTAKPNIENEVLPLANRFDETSTSEQFTYPPKVTEGAIITRVANNPVPSSSPLAISPITEIPSTSTTLRIILSSLKPAPSNTNSIYVNTVRPTSTIRVVKTTRPFVSIGANLVVPNPKALIDRVIMTAGAVLNSVTNTVTNTVVTVFKG